jgi:hypothetical protein
MKFVFDIPTQRSGEFNTLAGCLLYALGNGYPSFTVTMLDGRREIELMTADEARSVIERFSAAQPSSGQSE